MAIPSKETSELELRKNTKGQLSLWHRGKKIPVTDITYSTEPMQRGVVAFTILAQFIQMVDDGD